MLAHIVMYLGGWRSPSRGWAAARPGHLVVTGGLATGPHHRVRWPRV